jgi:O-antigen/teichoic acid export membrane protein
MTRHERDTAKGLAVSAILNVVLNLLLVPLLGIIGAAMATALSLITWNVLLWWAVRQRLGINSLAFDFDWRTIS